MYHLSVGDVLREERDTLGSEYGELIARNMEAGRIGPMEITVTLLERAMRAAFFKHRVKVFLIDDIAESFLRIGALCRFRFTLGINGLCLLGFPRKMDQLQLFEDMVARAAFALLLIAPKKYNFHGCSSAGHWKTDKMIFPILYKSVSKHLTILVCS